MGAVVRPKLLTEIVLDHLRERIVSGVYALGSALSERQLAEELQVSKTPIRESLVQLKTEGLVTIVPQKGAYVFTLSAREVAQICEYRMAIEGAALKLALQRDRKGLADDIGRIVGEMRIAHGDNRIKDYLALDTEFHATFFEHCGNDYLRQSHDRYEGKIAALRTHLSYKPMHTMLSLAEHIAFCELFIDGAETEIIKVLEAHIGRTRDAYSASIEDIAEADALKSAG